MNKLVENLDEKDSRPSAKGGRVVKSARSVKVAAAKKPHSSKVARQAAFRAVCVGMSSKSAVAMARLIPDADPSNFKVLRVRG